MPTTSTSTLIQGRVCKTKTSHPLNTSSLATLESKIGKSLLSEGSIANGSDEFDNLVGTSINIGSNHRAEDFANNDIHVITSPDLTNRNYCVVANYVSNEDTTTNGEATNTIKINSTTSNNVTSQILDDSSAYKNTSVKVTITDPYFTNPEFSDSNDNYLCTFDTTTNNNNVNRLIYTRNVNANTAHTDNSSTITASEYTEWNTQDGYGSFFINGYVTTDSTTGEPTATLYNEDASLNFLTKNFDISLNLSTPNVVPIYGRYQATFSQGNQSTVDVSYNGNSSLVLTTDLTSWASFLDDLNTSVPLDNLPESINVVDLENWVLPDGAVSNGFTLEVSSNSFTSSATLYNEDYASPFDLDLTNMEFTTKAMYILEKSMETNDSEGDSTLTNPTINGTQYFNRLTITNGSLSLEATADAITGYYVLLDGIESLSSSDWNAGQNGTIQSYNSSRVAAAGDSESIFPRASRSAVSSSEGILANFAVQYNSSESGYQSSVGLLSGTNLTASSVTYDVTTLVGQTSTLDGADNWDNIIGVNNTAVAIVRDSNSSISPSAITFFSNTNTYSNNNDNKLSVIDIECNKLWSESKAYDTTDTQISGLTADIKSFNMTSVPLDLKDIRFVVTAKSLSDLSLEVSGNWVLSCPDSVVTTSSEKLGLIDDSMITEKLLTEADSVTDYLFAYIVPRIDSVIASKFTKFHYNMEITYQDLPPQITYDDEFTILNYNKSAVTTSPEITNYLNVPANTKLYKRSYTESFNIKVPLRFGYINNLFLTSETLSYTIEYYVLTDNNNNNADLPRYYLNGVKDNNNDDIYATVTGSEENFQTIINFSNKDFKPYNISLEKKTDSAWINVTPDTPTYADLWYNTRSTVTSSIGSFYLSLTLSPDFTSLSNNTFYIDLELDKGTSSYNISGKKFTATELNGMSGINLNTFNLAGTSSGTSITYSSGAVSYTRDSDVNPNTQASTTLSADGYTFKLTGEMYLSIRIFVCPNGIFKLVKTSDGTITTTYHNITSVGGTNSLILDTGVYSYGNLLEAIRNTSSATWSLNNDAIQATYYGTTGFSYQRISSLNQEFRPSTGKRGFKTTILRGFTPNLSTTINRTATSYELELAGYSGDNYLFTNTGNFTIFGGIDIHSNSNTVSMYASDFETQTWNINLTYGSYTVSDTVDSLSDPVDTIVESFRSIISDRRGIKILSTSLNTNNFTYIVQFSSSNQLTIRRNPEFTAQDYSVSSTGYSVVNTFSPEDLRDNNLQNLVGNILQIHYTEAGTIPDINCQFSICPPYLKFTAIDPSGVSTIPFNSSLRTPVTRYLRVDNVNTTTSGSYYPFTNESSINNIRFEQNNVKQYLAYFTAPDASLNYMNVSNYDLKVELGSGLNSVDTVTDWYTYYDGSILNVNYSNDYVDITAPDSSRAFNISLNQQKHPSFSNFFVFDPSFAEYNLELEIGSSFISGPTNGSNTIILEFVAGDCTSLDLYAIQTFEKVSDNLQVTFVKYTGDAGISNQFLQRSTANGFSLPYTSKYTKTLSVSLNSTTPLTTTKRTLSDHLENLMDATTSTTFSSWTSASIGDGSPKLTFLPATSTGNAQLQNFVTLGQRIPRAFLSLTLEDYVRNEDIFEVPNFRIRYNGSTHSSSLNLSPLFSQSNLNSALPTATNL
jgi:hypothetical protein